MPRLVRHIELSTVLNAINKFEKRISGKGPVGAGKRFTLSQMKICIILKSKSH